MGGGPSPRGEGLGGGPEPAQPPASVFGPRKTLFLWPRPSASLDKGPGQPRALRTREPLLATIVLSPDT